MIRPRCDVARTTTDVVRQERPMIREEAGVSAFKSRVLVSVLAAGCASIQAAPYSTAPALTAAPTFEVILASEVEWE